MDDTSRGRGLLPGHQRGPHLATSGDFATAMDRRLIPKKGADVLLKALRFLGRSDISAALIGSQGVDAAKPATCYENSVRAIAAGLPDIVTMTSCLPREAVREAMGRADVVVVPSRWHEPFPLTVLVGVAAGAAVVGSWVRGIPGTLTDVGLLVPPDNPRSLAEALEALADDATLLRSITVAGRSYAETQDSAHASRMLAVVTEELG